MMTDRIRDLSQAHEMKTEGWNKKDNSIKATLVPLRVELNNDYGTMKMNLSASLYNQTFLHI